MGQFTRSGAFWTLLLGGAAVVLAAWVAGPRVLGLLASSAGVALSAAALAAVLGLPLGLGLAKTDLRGGGAALVILAGLLILPLHAVVAGWTAAFGFRGWVTALAAPTGGATAWLEGWSGAVAVHALAATPMTALLSAVALRAVDRRREEQALLETSASRVLLRVTLREAAPALLAVFVLVAVCAATEIAVTDLFRVRTFAEEVYTQAALGALNESVFGARATRGLAAGVALMALALLAPLVAVTGSCLTAMASGGDAWRAPLGRRRAWLAWAGLLGLIALAGFPIGSLAYKAGETVTRDEQIWRRGWSAQKCLTEVATAPWRHRREIAVSAAIGAGVATASLVAGGSVAWACRRRPIARKGLLLVAALGLATPGPVVGLATIRLLNQPLDSPIGWLGSLYGTAFAPWLAQTARLAPVAALLLLPVARSVSQTLLDAARSDGAGPLARLLRVAAPLRWPAVAAVWVVLLALSVGEVSATALVIPPGTPPLSVRLLSLLHYGVEDRVAALCLALFAACAFAAWVAVTLYRRAAPGDGRVS